MVGVFKTNVLETRDSISIIEHLRNHFPGSKINFDLEDCDKILRIEADLISIEKTILLVRETGYTCEVLE